MLIRCAGLNPWNSTHGFFLVSYAFNAHPSASWLLAFLCKTPLKPRIFTAKTQRPPRSSREALITCLEPWSPSRMRGSILIFLCALCVFAVKMPWFSLLFAPWSPSRMVYSCFSLRSLRLRGGNAFIPFFFRVIPCKSVANASFYLPSLTLPALISPLFRVIPWQMHLLDCKTLVSCNLNDLSQVNKTRLYKPVTIKKSSQKSFKR